MIAEINALEKNHTWNLVDLLRGKFVVGCMWVYIMKLKLDGSVDRYKAAWWLKAMRKHMELIIKKHLLWLRR